jgi:glycerol uptake facilitator-like aquaporin
MPHGVNAILNGIVVILIGMSYAYNCGGAINPARDFGPRFFTFVAGWGPQVFSAGNYFFWVPLVAPFFGAILATLLYLLLISNHL